MLSELFEEYLLECLYSKQLRAETIKGYKAVFTTFEKVMPEINDIKDVSPQMMTTFFRRISTRKRLVGKVLVKAGVKPSTIKTYHNKLMVFFSWLEKHQYISEGFLTQNITKPPDPVYEDAKALSSNAISKLISAVAMHSSDSPFLYKRDLVMMSLLIYTGIRKTEFLSLRVQDINFQDRCLFINGKTSKSKKSRTVPMHPTLAMHLRVYLQERKLRKSTCDTLIISSKSDSGLTSYGLKNWVEKYKKVSGVRFHLHQMRHTFACSLAKSGADIVTIMKALGHSTIRMTERYLRSITPEDSRSYIEKLSF